jgi:Carbohydrate-selective porin, OprB family
MKHITLALLVDSMLASAPAFAYEINDKISFGGILAVIAQCQFLTEKAEASDDCRGGLPFQPHIDIRLTEVDEIFFKLGFAVSNGLNKVSSFNLGSWGGDLEDDVKEINERHRDYLFTTWYKHTFELSEDKSLAVTFGIIDARDYLADNGYADDEYTQFMNEVFVNAANTFVPSYDAGGVLEWDYGSWSLRGVYMNVGRNDDDNNFNYGGVQLAYTAETGLGEGYYGILVNTTSDDFLNPQGTKKESQQVLLLNAGQQLGAVVAAWSRFGWANDAAAINYKALYSGGLNIIGRPWGRADDTIGLGYGYLEGGNQDLNYTHVAETYYRLVINYHLALTADIQWMHDKVKKGVSPEGVILCLRATSEF